MVEIPTSLYVAQWILLFFLGVLVLLLYRQLAYIMHIRQPRDVGDSLPPGTVAPTFRYRTVSSGEIGAGAEFHPGRTGRLLVLADPFCAACESLARELRDRRASDPLLKDWQLFIATAADAGQLKAVPAFAECGVPVGQVDAEVVREGFGAPFTPFAFAFSEDGAVAARGAATTIRELRDLVRAADAADGASPAQNGSFDLPVLEKSRGGEIDVPH